MAKQKTVLITRPEEDAKPLAALLELRGWRVISAPMMTVEYRASSGPLWQSPPQAVLITSANGARAFAKAITERDIPLITVGEASAEAAKHLGFRNVTMADPALGGDAKGLAAHVIRHCRPGSILMHVCGEDTAGNLAAMLPGFTVHHAVLYKAEAVKQLPPELFTVDTILFYSPRTAKIFLELAGRRSFARTEACALSHNVAAALTAAGFAHVHVATSPTQAALLALLDEQG